MSNKPQYELVNSFNSGSKSFATSNTITQKNEKQSNLKDLLLQLISAQTEQNRLLEKILFQLSASQRQRNLELAKWKQANPELANSCKIAAEHLAQIQTKILTNLAYEIDDNCMNLEDNEYTLSDFFEKYGPKLIHLNTLLQTLGALGNAPELPDVSL